MKISSSWSATFSTSAYIKVFPCKFFDDNPETCEQNLDYLDELRESLMLKVIYLDSYFDDREFQKSPIKYNYSILYYRFPSKIQPNEVIKFQKNRA